VYTCGRHGRQRPAEWVNEQRAWPCFGRERPIKHFNLVGQRILGQLWIANNYRHFFGNRVSFRQEGKNRARRILGEIIFTLAQSRTKFLVCMWPTTRCGLPSCTHRSLLCSNTSPGSLWTCFKSKPGVLSNDVHPVVGEVEQQQIRATRVCWIHRCLTDTM